MSFDISGLVATGTTSHYESMQGACNDADNSTKTTPGTGFSQPYEKSTVSVDAVAMRGLDVIRGSKTIDLTPGWPSPTER